jgi:hypothetical protein
LLGGFRITVDGVGTAAMSHEPNCVWVEPSSGDIIWCDNGGTDGSGTGAIRRRSAVTGQTSVRASPLFTPACTCLTLTRAHAACRLVAYGNGGAGDAAVAGGQQQRCLCCARRRGAAG